MKILLFIALLCAGVAWFFTSNGEPTNITPLPAPTTVPVKPYAFVIAKPEDVTLVSNFSDKKTSTTLIEENLCIAAVNGSFYDTSGNPLGLFISNFQKIHDRTTSALMNGYIAVDASDRALIGNELPESNNRIALQTGPLLIVNGQPLPLAIKNDEPARRMVAAINTDGTFIFLVLIDPENTFSGPRLADMPEIVAKINKEELLNITNAINLDGGSASAFFGNNTVLSELTPIGSLFCMKAVQ